MTITIRGNSMVFQAPQTVLQVLEKMLPDEQDAILACFSGGIVLELNTVLFESAELAPITYRNEEGRRIYERSLRFVLLIAARRIFPDYKLRIEHSLGQGVYIEMEGLRLNPSDVNTLEGEMQDIIQMNLPFVPSRWSKEEAIEYFQSHGDEDKARLLNYRPYDFFSIYTCGGVSEYFYGAMLPSTGGLRVFSLKPNAPGFLLQLPDRDNPDVPAEFVSLPKHMAVFAQSNYWCKVLDCSTAADLNGLIVNNRLREFIRVNEAFHSKSLSEIAEDIVKRGARAIFISGPSSSGKTTFANRLSIHLKVNGLKTLLVSLDDFYRTRSELPLEANGHPDLEALSAIDVPLLLKTLENLLAGQETRIPRFDFIQGRQVPGIESVRIDSNTVLIIEGIHGLNPALHASFDKRLLCRIYISQLTTLNLDRHNRIRTTDARLLRRIVRDYQFRATPPIRTLEMWDSVRDGEQKWIFPFQEQADIVFNSALHYELPILKTISFGILGQVPKDSPHYIKCERILKILNYLLPVPKEMFNEIPPLSILREFIGGNTLYLKE